MQRVRFGPERIALLPVLIFLAGALPLATSTRWLSPLLLLPLACAVWVLRARVVADADGLRVCNGLAARSHPWSAVDGVDVPRRGPVRLLLSGGRREAMTALGRRDVRRLLELAPRTSTPGTPTPGTPTPGTTAP